MSSPAISVVIPCYNLGLYLPEAVESVVAMRRPEIEIVLVDDGSTDVLTIAEISRAEAGGARVVRQSNCGVSAARNAGIAAARAEIIVPLDADDRLQSALMDHALRVFAEQPRTGVVYGDAEYIGERAGRWFVGPFDRHRLLSWNYIPACAAIRRAVWQENGGYDSEMPSMGLEDWDFWLGACGKGWDFEYVPEVMFDYRVRTGSLTSRMLGFEKEITGYLARKHGALYREAFLRLIKERGSLRQDLGLAWERMFRRLF